MRLGVLAAVVVASAAVPGCILDDLLGGCDPAPWVAKWEEEGLIGRLPPDGDAAGHVVASHLKPTQLDLTDAHLDARYGAGNYSLVSVSFQSLPGTNRFDGGEIYVSSQGNASMQVLADVDNDTASRSFQRLLENVTELDEAARQGLAEAFVANRTLFARVYSSQWGPRDREPSQEDFRDVWVLYANVTGPWKLDSLFGQVFPNASASRLATDENWRAENWTFRFDLMERSAQRDFGSSVGRLVLDLHGGAEYEIDAETKPPQQYMRDRLAESLDELGLPRPAGLDVLEFRSRVRC